MLKPFYLKTDYVTSAPLFNPKMLTAYIFFDRRALEKVKGSYEHKKKKVAAKTVAKRICSRFGGAAVALTFVFYYQNKAIWACVCVCVIYVIVLANRCKYK